MLADLNPLSFMKKRLLRFWPVVIVGGVLSAPMIGAEFGVLQGMLIVALNLLFIPYFRGNDTFPLNPPYWSLSFELFANFIHAVAFARLTTRAMLAVIGGCAAAMFGLALHYGGVSLGGSPVGYWGGFARVTLSYSIGIVLYRLWRDRPPFSIPLPGVLLAAAIYVAGQVKVWPLELAFVLIAVPLVIAGGLRSRFSLPMLGEASFPLYALHVPVIAYSRDLGLPQWGACVAAVTAAIGFVIVEQHLRRRQPKPPEV